MYEQWQKCLGGNGPGQDIAYSVQQTTDGCYIVAGVTASNDGDVSGNHGTGGTEDMWVVKLCYMVSADEIAINKNDVNIFPNPFFYSATLQAQKPLQSATLIIYDMLGKEIKRMENLNGTEITIQRDKMKSGMYFYS